jgi:putative ABC transport system permease protein
MGLVSLNSNKLRSSLTILGIAIGVFSVVGVMTALSAMRLSIDKGLEVFGGGTFQISKFPAVQINDGWWNYRDRPRIDYRQARRFKIMMESDSDALVCMYLTDGGEIARYKDRKTKRNLRVIGSNENYLECFPIELEFGRNLTTEDVEFNRTVTVVGAEIVKALFPNENPLGKTISQKGTRYTIVGVLKEKGQSFGTNPDQMVMIPVTRFLSNRSERYISLNLAVKSPGPEVMSDYQDQAIGILRVVRGLEPEDPNNFEITSNDAIQDMFDTIAVMIGTGGLIISAIALVTAGVGVMNIMLVSVTERTREIGIRKSIGARSKDILKQFLLEAIFLSEVGGVLGIIIGIIAGNVIAAQMEVSMIFPWFWSGVAIATCSAIGIVFGLYPAYKAANLHPIDALRFE